MHFGRYGCRLNRRQATRGPRAAAAAAAGDGRPGSGPKLEIEALDALRRQRSHRSCRGFPRSSSLSPGVYLRVTLLCNAREPGAHAHRGSDLSFIRSRRDVRPHGCTTGLSELAVIFQWCQEPWPAPHGR